MNTKEKEVYDGITSAALKTLLDDNGIDSAGDKPTRFAAAVAAGLIDIPEEESTPANKYAKYAQISQEAVVKRREMVEKGSRFDEILDADLVITNLGYRSDVQTKMGIMRMITIEADANAFTPEGEPINHLFKAKVTTNVKWLNDYSLEVGSKKRAKIGLVKEQEWLQLCENYARTRNITMNEAKAIIPAVEIIFSNSIRSFADIVDLESNRGLLDNLNTVSASASQIVAQKPTNVRANLAGNRL